MRMFVKQLIVSLTSMHQDIWSDHFWWKVNEGIKTIVVTSVLVQLIALNRSVEKKGLVNAITKAKVLYIT